MSGASERRASVVFEAAIGMTSPRLDLKPGLKAIKKGEGHGQIVAEDPKRLLGNAAIDDDCRTCDPSRRRQASGSCVSRPARPRSVAAGASWGAPVTALR